MRHIVEPVSVRDFVDCLVREFRHRERASGGFQALHPDPLTDGRRIALKELAQITFRDTVSGGNPLWRQVLFLEVRKNIVADPNE